MWLSSMRTRMGIADRRWLQFSSNKRGFWSCGELGRSFDKAFECLLRIESIHYANMYRSSIPCKRLRRLFLALKRLWGRAPCLPDWVYIFETWSGGLRRDLCWYLHKTQRQLESTWKPEGLLPSCRHWLIAQPVRCCRWAFAAQIHAARSAGISYWFSSRNKYQDDTPTSLSIHQSAPFTS